MSHNNTFNVTFLSAAVLCLNSTKQQRLKMHLKAALCEIGNLIIMNFKKIFVLLVLLNSTNLALSCELTEKYIEARNEFAKQIRKPYVECIKSVSNVEYWYRFSQCFKAGDGEGVGGGCGHIVSIPRERYKSLGIEDSFCSVLDFSTDKKIQLMDQYAESKDIVKCK